MPILLSLLTIGGDNIIQKTCTFILDNPIYFDEKNKSFRVWFLCIDYHLEFRSLVYYCILNIRHEFSGFMNT